MALYDGKNIRGSIGNISFRKIDKNTTTVQSNPGKGRMKQTVNTKKSASLFGRLISPFAKHIRFNFRMLINDFADRKMVNRMNSAISIVINQHLEPDGKIIFHRDSFSRLKGFDFNVNSPLFDSLLLMPTVTFEQRKLMITFPSFKVMKVLKFPENTNQATIQIQPLFFNLSKGLGLRAVANYLSFEKTQGMTEAVTFNYDLPSSAVCLVGLSIVFTSNQNIANHKLFHPAGICAAHYSDESDDPFTSHNWYKTGFSLDEK